MPGRVIVVGSVNVDFVVVAQRLPGPGETVTGGDVARHHGGKGGNQAVAAARLGAPVTLVGAVGLDDLGDAAIAALAAEGVGTAHVARVDRPTGVALILVDGEGENLIAVAPGANGEVSAAAVTGALRHLDPGPDDVILVVAEIPASTIRAALAAGREADATTILNPAPADGLDREVTDLADVITPNERELAVLAAAVAAGTGGAESPARRAVRRAGTGPGRGSVDDLATTARMILDSPGRGGPRAAVVTLGRRGALVVPAVGDPALIPAAAVDAVDATGAGDAFNGALAAGLAAGMPLLQAVPRAVVAAGMSTTRPGARAGMPTTVELDAFVTGLGGADGGT